MSHGRPRHRRRIGHGIGATSGSRRGRPARSAGRIGRSSRARMPPPLGSWRSSLPFASFRSSSTPTTSCRSGIDTLIFMLLALGLNVVVGWVGLLDLGYVAFFGIGAYVYAPLASDHFGLHWEAQWAIPVIVAACAPRASCSGCRRGGSSATTSPSSRSSSSRSSSVCRRPVNLPLGPRTHPRPERDLRPRPAHLLRPRAHHSRWYYYVAVVAFAVVMARAVPREPVAHRARVARAARGRARRGADDHARRPAEAPRVRLRRGSRRARRTSCAAQQGAIFPVELRPPDAHHGLRDGRPRGGGQPRRRRRRRACINISLEALATPENASLLFYGALVLGLVAMLRPWRVCRGRMGGRSSSGSSCTRSRTLSAVARRRDDARAGPDRRRRVALGAPPRRSHRDGTALMYLALIAAVLGLTLVAGALAARRCSCRALPRRVVWENIMLPQPSVSRFVLIGAMLVALMAARPQGLFGQPAGGDRLSAEARARLQAPSRSRSGG